MALAGSAVVSDAFAAWATRMRRLAYDRDAVLLAHNYQAPWIQDVADHVGDSLELSRRAAETDASVIVFCGVHFMAETAKLLSPDKLVLIPDLAAGCSLAETITADQLRRWKAEHPGAVVVSYVNTSAAVKAESDYCCTSANAAAVVQSIPEDREILFLPDMFLGAHVERVTGRTMHLWMGECHVHAGIEPSDLDARLAEHPDAEFHVHPECGCASQALWLASSGAIPPDRVHVLGTAGMQRRARSTGAREVVVATEVGLLHRLRAESPGVDFIPANPAAICRYMKLITPEKLERSLTEMVYEVDVPDDIARRARGAIERMIEIG